VGVNGDGSNDNAGLSGAAYVFVRSGGVWTQQAYLKASNTAWFDLFGSSVAVSGDTVVVGAYAEDSNAAGVNGNQNDNSAFTAGAAYVFVRSGTTWTQQAYLKAHDTAPFDWFGIAVAVSGDTIVVGGLNADTSGTAYVFVRAGSSWVQQAALKASNAAAQDEFACSPDAVAIEGDLLVVGAYAEDSAASGVNGNQLDNSLYNAGAAYVFARVGSTWNQEAYLKASNPDLWDAFGTALALSGQTIVVSSHNEGSSATGIDGDQSLNDAPLAGAAYVFTKTGGLWVQQAYLKASNTEAYDKFGDSLSMSGDLLVVGARGEDSAATRVDGDELNNSANEAGAAYLFHRVGTTWRQLAYLKAPNTDAGDWFSWSSSIDGTTVLVSALAEDSAAVGVDGDLADDSADFAGAAYVFEFGPGIAFCGGGGDAIRCPCANDGSPGHGCDNSAGTGGARLSASGWAEPDSIVLTSEAERSSALSIFLQGDAALAGGMSFGDGVRCVTGNLKRIAVVHASGGVATYPQAGDPGISRQSAALGDPIAPGSSRFYQVYYRDPDLAFCPLPSGNSWNVGNALQIPW
jgi:drug/metabolite transporter superfamily protein YnfA